MKGRLVVHRFKCGEREWHEVHRVVGYRGINGVLYDKVSEAWIATKEAPTEELEFVRNGNPLDLWDKRSHMTYDGEAKKNVNPMQDEMRDPAVALKVKQALEAN